MDSYKPLSIKQASSADYEMLCHILEEHHLPAKDCLAHLAHFFILELDQQTVGIGGLELHDQHGLLRSIVVLDNFRRRGIGKHLIKHIIKYASTNGVRSLYLITEDAQDYFNRLGFHAVDRSSVPQAIQQTQQFKCLCPASAVLMSMDIYKP